MSQGIVINQSYYIILTHMDSFMLSYLFWIFGISTTLLITISWEGTISYEGTRTSFLFTSFSSY